MISGTFAAFTWTRHKTNASWPAAVRSPAAARRTSSGIRPVTPDPVGGAREQASAPADLLPAAPTPPQPLSAAAGSWPGWRRCLQERSRPGPVRWRRCCRQPTGANSGRCARPAPQRPQRGTSGRTRSRADTQSGTQWHPRDKITGRSARGRTSRTRPARPPHRRPADRGGPARVAARDPPPRRRSVHVAAPRRSGAVRPRSGAQAAPGLPVLRPSPAGRVRCGSRCRTSRTRHPASRRIPSSHRRSVHARHCTRARPISHKHGRSTRPSPQVSTSRSVSRPASSRGAPPGSSSSPSSRSSSASAAAGTTARRGWWRR